MPGQLVVTKAQDLGRLERGLVMYEVSYADRPRIMAGFVFVTPVGWDYREVDGKRLSRRGTDQKAVDLIRDLTAAVNQHRAAGGEVE